MIRFSDGCDPLEAAAPAAAADSGGAVLAGGVDRTLHIPTATRRVKSGVTTKSVTRMGVRPHESRCLPSAS